MFADMLNLELCVVVPLHSISLVNGYMLEANIQTGACNMLHDEIVVVP